MGFIQATACWANVKLLVVHDRTELKILTFQTYQKMVKLRDSQLETMEMKKNSSSGKKLQWEYQLPHTDANEQKPFKLGEVKKFG